MGSEKSTTKKAKKAPVKKVNKHYIVTFDVYGGDPVQVFDSLDKAKKFVAALLTKSEDAIESVLTPSAYSNWDIDLDEVVASSIKVYEGSLIGTPNVEVVFKLR